MEPNKTAAILQQFNETIDKWISYLDDYTLEILSQKPRNGGWSLGQVYRHIIDDTTWFVEQMKVSVENNVDSEKEMHADAKWILGNNGFPDILIEGPATNTYIPQPNSKEELSQGLVSIRDEANRLYLTFDFSASPGKTRHPGLLYFNATEWLRFAEIHMRHHFRQKKRIDEDLQA